MTYEELVDRVQSATDDLRRLGYGTGDRVVMALPHGPEAALAFLVLAGVGVDEDFFACGGDSLSGLRLLAMVREVFGVEIPPMAMYDETSTVARMACFIERSLARPR